MNRDELLLMEDKSFVTSILRTIFNRKPRDFRAELIRAIDKVSKEFRDTGKEREIVNVINKYTNTHITRIDDLKNDIRLLESTDDINEDNMITKWWDVARDNIFGAASFYPLLNAFLELDKIIKGTGDANWRTVLIYTLIWAFIVGMKSSKNAFSFVHDLAFAR